VIFDVLAAVDISDTHLSNYTAVIYKDHVGFEFLTVGFMNNSIFWKNNAV
jgi:hypothetical protein